MAATSIRSAPRPLSRPSVEPDPDGLRGVPSAALWGLLAALAPALLLALPGLAVWLADPASTVPWWRAAATGPQAWVLAHRGPLTVDDPASTPLRLELWPALLTLLPLAVVAHTTRRALDDPSTSRMTWGLRLGAHVTGYLAGALAVAGAAGWGPVTALGTRLMTGALIVALAGAGLALARLHRQGHEVVGRLVSPAGRLPGRLLATADGAAALRAARAGILALLGLGALLVVAAALARAGRVGALSASLDPGPTGTLGLWLAQLALLPVLALWALSWAVGSGFSVGAAHVGWSGVSPGLLPALPLLGALPDAGPFTGPWWLVALLPAGVGALIARLCARQPAGCIGPSPEAPGGLLGRLRSPLGRATAGAVALVWAVMVALQALARASVTPGSLSQMGAPVASFAALLALELAVGALAGLLTAAPSRSSSSDADPGQARDEGKDEGADKQ